MTYIVSSGALNSTPTNQRGTWQIVLRYHRSVDFFLLYWCRSSVYGRLWKTGQRVAFLGIYFTTELYM